MKASRKQTKLNKASRCVIRRIEQGHAHLVGTISQAARRFGVKQHDLWLRIQSEESLDARNNQQLTHDEQDAQATRYRVNCFKLGAAALQTV